MEDLKMTIALLFKRAGKQALSENEMRFALSMDLKWFAPSEARAIVDCAIKTGVVAKTTEGIKPAFDIASIEVPLGFRPGKSVLECAIPPRNIFKEIAEYTCAKLGVDEDAVVAEINKEIEAFGGLLDPRAAAAIVAAKHGIDAKKYAEEVERLILKGA